MKPVLLNEKLFGLILFLQKARDYYIARREILDSEIDWYCLVLKEYKQIPTAVFEQAKITQNLHNFDEALNFIVTPEMMDCHMDKLSQFKTGFWG